MSTRYPHGIGPTGRWLIFAGFPFSFCAVLLACTLRDGNIRGVSESFLPYVVAGVPSTIMIGGMFLYGYVPKWLVLPLGIGGWVVSASVLCWFFWFGPGAFGRRALPNMSNTVVRVIAIDVGVLSGVGALPLRLGASSSNRYWRRNPTRFTTLSRIGGSLLAISIGAAFIWSERTPERYRALFLVPVMLGFVLGAAGRALDRQT